MASEWDLQPVTPRPPAPGSRHHVFLLNWKLLRQVHRGCCHRSAPLWSETASHSPWPSMVVAFGGTLSSFLSYSETQAPPCVVPRRPWADLGLTPRGMPQDSLCTSSANEEGGRTGRLGDKRHMCQTQARPTSPLLLQGSGSSPAACLRVSPRVSA